jgi:hypothetical protein
VGTWSKVTAWTRRWTDTWPGWFSPRKQVGASPPAISVPGRLVHRAMSRAAAMVSHGPAMNSPMMISAKLVTNAWLAG